MAALLLWATELNGTACTRASLSFSVAVMDPLREFIGNSMIAVLPHLQHIDDLVDFVLGRGVKKERDLRHITADILNEILDYVDSCDLFEAWQKTYGMFFILFLMFLSLYAQYAVIFLMFVIWLL